VADSYFPPDSVYGAGGSGTGGASFLNCVTAQVTLSGSVAAGELVCITEDGMIRRVNELTPISCVTNPSLTPVTVNTASLPGLTNISVSVPSLMLPNGNVVTPGSQYFLIGGPLGGEGILTGVSITDGTHGPNASVLINVPNTDSQWLWAAGVHFGINAKDGSVVLASTNWSAPDGATISAAGVLANGNIVVAGYAPTPYYAGFAMIFTTAGVQVGSTITLTSVDWTSLITVTPCANGEFIVGVTSTAEPAPRLYRYTAAGAAASDWTTAVMSANSPGSFNVWELSSGVVVCYSASTATNASALYFLSSAGVILLQWDLGTQTQSRLSNGFGFVRKGGFYLVAVEGLSAGNFSLTFSSFDQYGRGVVCRAPLVQTASEFLSAAADVGNGIALVTGNQFIVVGPEGTLRGSPISLGNSTTSASIVASGRGLALVTTWDGSGNTYKSAFQCQLSSILGVAQGSGSNGSSITVNAAGFYSLPSTQVMLCEGSFDNRSGPLIGTCGVIGAQQAFLGGWR
jgi:hypothetical protein